MDFMVDFSMEEIMAKLIRISKAKRDALVASKAYPAGVKITIADHWFIARPLCRMRGKALCYGIKPSLCMVHDKALVSFPHTEIAVKPWSVKA